MKFIEKLLKNKNRDYYAGFLVLAFFWFGFLGFSGALSSGFHFTDDHEIVRIKEELRSQSTMQVSKKWVVEDLQRGRLRIVYYFHRVLEAKVLGTNFIAWSTYTAILAIVTSFFLFSFLKLVDFSFFESLLFPLLVLIGSQISVWWRLGPAETLGIFLLATSLFFLALHIIAKKHKFFFGIIFVVLAILAALTKESFLLFLPAIILLTIYLSHEKNVLTWKESVKKNVASVTTLMIAFIILILYIKFFLGTAGTGYAGVDGFDPKSYLEIFWSLTRSNWLGNFVLTQLVLMVGIVFLKIRNNSNRWKIPQTIKKLAFLAILFFTIVVPQVVLYAKSGFFERYLLPVLLGYALVFIYLLRQIGKISKAMRAGMILLALFFVWGDVRNNFQDAQKFAKDGKNIGKLFSTVNTKTMQNDTYLIVGDPVFNYEWAESIWFYMDYELGRKNLFVYPLARKEKVSPSEFEKNLALGFGGFYGTNRYENIQDKGIIDAVILFPGMDKVFSRNQAGIDFLKNENVVRNNLGGYVIYYKKK